MPPLRQECVPGGVARTGARVSCDLIEPIGLSQPTVSHHLKVLHETGLVDREKRGVWVFYKARPQALSALAQLLNPAPLVKV